MSLDERGQDPVGVPPGGEPPAEQPRGLHNNPMSYAGTVVMVVGLLLILAALAWQLSFGAGSPYLGILAFMVFPTIVLVGLLLFLWGGRRESARRRREPGRLAAAYRPRGVPALPPADEAAGLAASGFAGATLRDPALSAVPQFRLGERSVGVIPPV